MENEFRHSHVKSFLWLLAMLFLPTLSYAQSDKDVSFFPNISISYQVLYWSIIIPLAALIGYFSFNMKSLMKKFFDEKYQKKDLKFKAYLSTLNSKDIQILKDYKQKKEASSTPSTPSKNTIATLIVGILMSLPYTIFAQTPSAMPAKRETLFSEPGVVITFVLIFIPLFLGIVFLLMKVQKILRGYFNQEKAKEAAELAEYLSDPKNLPDDAVLDQLQARFDYSVPTDELSGDKKPEDDRGLLTNIKNDHNLPFFATKKKPVKRPKIDPELTKLVLAYLGSAIFWLVIGTSVGEYVGIKFVLPDADSVSWLSFGVLRVVHTNIVFWAWATIGIMGLGYYVVPTVSNTPLYNMKKGWWALLLVNVAMLVGPLSVMAGINNGGGEYREYVWPIMAMWAAGLMLTLYNFIKTVANRTTKEIYISSWYIIAAYIFILIVATLAYLPFGQNGIGETILQGYYMHQAVGMWFMFSLLGFLYYFLPQQLNKPIYSYSLGVLAFWTQILFYTLIGTHHFVFSALPWWLQTVAIVGSVGMLIPVTSGTINYLMTFKGSWNKVSSSYSLPFFLVGVIYYFTGSFQGTAEAFRTTNLIWHFTDFTIAHSHITMYGIISFLLFGGIYAIVPRLTGHEPPQQGVGAHFWLALVGLQFYTIPLMIGGTLKGLSWAEGKPFIDGVVLMAPYWLWRAIGGSLMWLSHIVLAYNFYKMMEKTVEIDVKEKAIELISEKISI